MEEDGINLTTYSRKRTRPRPTERACNWDDLFDAEDYAQLHAVSKAYYTCIRKKRMAAARKGVFGIPPHSLKQSSEQQRSTILQNATEKNIQKTERSYQDCCTHVSKSIPAGSCLQDAIDPGIWSHIDTFLDKTSSSALQRTCLRGWSVCNGSGIVQSDCDKHTPSSIAEQSFGTHKSTQALDKNRLDSIVSSQNAFMFKRVLGTILARSSNNIATKRKYAGQIIRACAWACWQGGLDMALQDMHLHLSPSWILSCARSISEEMHGVGWGWKARLLIQSVHEQVPPE